MPSQKEPHNWTANNAQHRADPVRQKLLEPQNQKYVATQILTGTSSGRLLIAGKQLVEN